MNKIILCEGETDAILLSYYLDKVSGWKFCKKPPVNISIKGDAFIHSINSTVNLIDSDYKDRRDLYNLYHLINHLNLFDGTYYTAVISTIDYYV